MVNQDKHEKDNTMTLLTHLMCLVSATGPTSHSAREGRRRTLTAPLSGGAWLVREAETGKRKIYYGNPEYIFLWGYLRVAMQVSRAGMAALK